MKTRCCALLVLLTASCTAIRSDGPVPAYRCPLIDREIEITGKLDDPLWDTAPSAKLVGTDTGEPGRFETEARLLCSKTTLYIGFRCADDHVWATKTKHDADVWTEECLEVFISPAGTLHQYYELNVNPLNAVFDACLLNPRLVPGNRERYRGLWDYTAEGMKTKTHVDGKLDQPGEAKGWTAEYAVPLNQLVGAPNVPPRPGDRWRLNLYRIDKPGKGKTEFYAWSPTRIIDYHTPLRFGVLEFAAAKGD